MDSRFTGLKFHPKLTEICLNFPIKFLRRTYETGVRKLYIFNLGNSFCTGLISLDDFVDGETDTVIGIQPQ